MNIEKLNSYCPIIKDNPLFFYLLYKKIFFISTVLDNLSFLDINKLNTRKIHVLPTAKKISFHPIFLAVGNT